MTETEKKKPKKPDDRENEVREVECVVGEDTFFDEISAKLEDLGGGETDAGPEDESISIELGTDDKEDRVEVVDDADFLAPDEFVTIELGLDDAEDAIETPAGSDSPAPPEAALPAGPGKGRSAAVPPKMDRTAGGERKSAVPGREGTARKPGRPVVPPAALKTGPAKPERSKREIIRRRGKTLPKTVMVIVLALGLPVIAAIVGYFYLFPGKARHSPGPVTARRIAPAPPAVVRKKITMPPPVDTAPGARKPAPVEEPVSPATAAVTEAPRSAPTEAEAAPGARQPARSSRPEMEPEILDFLARWKAAWEKTAGQGGDMDAYIAFYSDGFSSRGLDKKGWEADKARKNRRKSYIQVDVSNVRISPPGPDGKVTVTFFQDFRSSNYSSQSEKALVLKREADGWKILEDR